MTEQKLYAGIIRKGENSLSVHFHDLSIDAAPVYDADLNIVISSSVKEIADKLTEYFVKNKVWPEPMSLYQVPIHSCECGRVLLSFALDSKDKKATCSGYLFTDSDVDKDDSLWNQANKVFSSIDDAVTVSDDYRQFRKFRKLMEITDKIKSKIHCDSEKKYDEREASNDGYFSAIIRKVTSSREDRIHDEFKKNWDISIEVYNRLLTRYAILRDIEKLEKRYGVHESLTSENPQPVEIKNKPPRDDGNAIRLNPDLRAYRIATTDVFVEKAIAFLEVDSTEYRNKGRKLFNVATGVIVGGLLAAGYKFWDNDSIHISTSFWEFLSYFAPAFTFYGMIVILAVGLWRLGKAMLDQAERLLDRRHALRQGRLFVHLNDGALKLDELEKAFAWNASNRNAFENIQTEASAPWGGLFKDALKAVADTFGRERKGAKD